MKLLFDENLSRRLVGALGDLFPESTHVALLQMLRASDLRIWEYAKAQGFSIVTADGDFYELATARGAPPRIIWLRGCDYPTPVAEGLIRSQAVRIMEFLEDPDRAVLIINP